MTWIIFTVGATIAGFIQGLTGFAFGLVAMSFWVWVLPPQMTASLVVFASLWSHIISFYGEKTTYNFSYKILIPYIVAGLTGIPLGTFLLTHIDQQSFKIILGGFLIFWCPCMLLQPKIRFIRQSGRIADSIIGFCGGILGGLGGFSGALPSAWVMLKNLNKNEQRYILRHFNFAIQCFVMLSYIIQSHIYSQHLPYFVILMIAVSIPAILGARLFYKISELQFKRIVLSLLFMSGLLMCLSQFL